MLGFMSKKLFKFLCGAAITASMSIPTALAIIKEPKVDVSVNIDGNGKPKKKKKKKS